MSVSLIEQAEPEDDRLVAKAQAGDRSAFSELVRRHQTVVYRVCYGVLGNLEDAEDAAQEAFLRAYDKLCSFQGHSSFRTWMLRLAVNLSLNYRTRRKTDLPLLDGQATSDPGPEAQAIRSDDTARLHTALQQLQPGHRAAVVLRDLEGIGFREIGELLEVPEGTARVWAYRGRQRLKDLLA